LTDGSNLGSVLFRGLHSKCLRRFPMAISFPKPSKPNYSLQVNTSGFPGTYTKYDGAGNQYTSGSYDPGIPDVTYGQRTYGSGLTHPVRGDKFKLCSDYKVLGLNAQGKRGVCITQYRPEWNGGVGGVISNITSGPPTWGYPQWDNSLGSPHFNGLSFVSMPSNIRARLATEVMLKVGGKKASLGEALAESKETVHLLVNSALRLYKAYRAVRHGNIRGLADALGVSPRKILKKKSTSSLWLEYQYGWKPLMSDIYDCHQLLQKGFREKAQIASSVRHLKDDWEVHRKSDPSSGAIYTLDAKSSGAYTAKVFYSIDDSTLSRYAQVGMINPLSIAWELVPFSFVVDWFVPVGNFLEALTAPIGVNFISGYYGTRCEGYLSECSPGSPPANQITVSDSRLRTYDIFGYTRESLLGFPTPALYYKSPFSTNHALNAFALLSQLTKR